MDPCQKLFSKCADALNNYNYFEEYYNYLKNQNANNLFCEYQRKDKKKSLYL